MTVERSERGELTTKADYTNYDTYYEGLSVNSGQWDYDSNTVLYYNFSAQPPSYPVLQKRCISVFFNGTTTNNDDLEFGVITRLWNDTYTGTALSETSWFPANTEVFVRGNILRYTDQYPSTAFTVFVRRKDGGILTPSSMEASVIMLHNDRQVNIEQTTAIPNDWVTGTSQSFQTDVTTMTTVVPTICDIDDNEFNAFIDIPNKIVAGLNLCIMGIGSLLNLKYVTFTICFVLIVGLIAWLIH